MSQRHIIICVIDTWRHSYRVSVEKGVFDIRRSSSAAGCETHRRRSTNNRTVIMKQLCGGHHLTAVEAAVTESALPTKKMLVQFISFHPSHSPHSVEETGLAKKSRVDPPSQSPACVPMLLQLAVAA